jgi:hypothetical protein
MTKHLLVLVAALLVASPAFGQATHGFQFTWTDPVERTDGQPIVPDEELTSYRLSCSGHEQVERIVEREATEAVGQERTYFWSGAVQRGGWYECSMSVFDTDGLESDMSEMVSVRKQAKPNPPSNVRGQ